jgi:hypothetical protein
MVANQSVLATAGNLTEAHLVHNRIFSYQEREDGEWVDKGSLALFENAAFLNGEKLHNVQYHKPSQSIHYSFGRDEEHRSGRLFFTENHLAFIGTVNANDGTVKPVSGSLPPTIFHTSRKLQSGSDYTSWETFSLASQWVGEGRSRMLETIYKLGEEDISDRTAVVKVHQWETTIKMDKEHNKPFGGKKDTFEIVIDYQGYTFQGIYTDAQGTVYDWKGTVQEESRSAIFANASAFFTIDTPPLTARMQPMVFAAGAASTTDTTSTLNVQSLMNVSSITEVEINGEKKVLDSAQNKTGEYFQNILINSLEQKWIDDFFGGKKVLPDGVQKVMDNHNQFYKDKAVMNLGQMIHDCFGTVENDKDIVKKIDNEKLAQAWQDLGKNADYGAQSSELYIQGYKDGVPGIQPYFADNPKDWAKSLYETIVSDHFLNMWTIQLSSDQFKNPNAQIYEWYVQLCVLDPDPIDPNSADPHATYATQMLYHTFPVVLGYFYDQVKWDASYLRSYLEQAIDNMLNGSTQFADEMVKNNAEVMQQRFKEMIGIFNDVEEFTDAFVNSLTIWANKPENARRPMIQWVDQNDMYDGVAQMFERAGRSRAGQLWEGCKDFMKEWSGPILYATGAGFLIYQLFSGNNLNPIEEISLSLMATGFAVKSIEKLFATTIGNWLRRKIESFQGKIAELAQDMTKWFTKEGIVAETKIGKAITTVLGKSAAEFFAKRVGPALGILGVVISSMDLAKAIRSGRTRDIVFESINVFFSLLDVAFIGLELAGFAWAGPVGFGIAIVGLLVTLVKLIWDICSPPPLPPDPVHDFVNGPLKDAGFVLA